MPLANMRVIPPCSVYKAGSAGIGPEGELKGPLSRSNQFEHHGRAINSILQRPRRFGASPCGSLAVQKSSNRAMVLLALKLLAFLAERATPGGVH